MKSGSAHSAPAFAADPYNLLKFVAYILLRSECFLSLSEFMHVTDDARLRIFEIEMARRNL